MSTLASSRKHPGNASKRKTRKVNSSAVALADRLENLSNELDRLEKLEGRKSMIQFNLQLPYCTSEPIRLSKEHHD